MAARKRKVWVTCYDGVYSMWRGEYERYVSEAEAGKCPDLADFGARLVGTIEANVTDLPRTLAPEGMEVDSPDWVAA